MSEEILRPDPRTGLTDQQIQEKMESHRNPLPQFAVGPKRVQLIIDSLLTETNGCSGEVNHSAFVNPWRNSLFRPR